MKLKLIHNILTERDKLCYSFQRLANIKDPVKINLNKIYIILFQLLKVKL